MTKILSILTLAVLVISACTKENSGYDPAKQLALDREKIRTYLKQNNLQADSTSSGLYYKIDSVGSGTAFPTLQSKVTVYYTGFLLNGLVFDRTNPGQPATFTLSQVIVGWQEGIQKLKKGGKGRFYIPSVYGYGSQSVGSIPANSVLIFDVQLVDFQ